MGKMIVKFQNPSKAVSEVGFLSEYEQQEVHLDTKEKKPFYFIQEDNNGIAALALDNLSDYLQV